MEEIDKLLEDTLNERNYDKDIMKDTYGVDLDQEVSDELQEALGE